MKKVIARVFTERLRRLAVVVVFGLFGTFMVGAITCYVSVEKLCPQKIGECWLIDDTDVRHEAKTADAGYLTTRPHPISFDCWYACPGETQPVGAYPTIVFSGTCPPA